MLHGVLLYTILISVVAGLIAGVGAGIAGVSSAIIVSPILITCLNINAYDAIGMALSVDVFSSIAASVTFFRHGNINLKAGSLIIVTILIFTALGSLVSSYIPDELIMKGVVFITLFVGLRFILSPNTTPKEMSINQKKNVLFASGVVIGLICGVFGAGGGMMVVLVLVAVLRYDIKVALGTGVFSMIFIALVGAGSHFVISGGIANIMVLLICGVSAVIGAKLAAIFAHHVQAKTMNRIVGVVIACVAMSTIVMEYLV